MDAARAAQALSSDVREQLAFPLDVRPRGGGAVGFLAVVPCLLCLLGINLGRLWLLGLRLVPCGRGFSHALIPSHIGRSRPRVTGSNGSQARRYRIGAAEQRRPGLPARRFSPGTGYLAGPPGSAGSARNLAAWA